MKNFAVKIYDPVSLKEVEEITTQFPEVLVNRLSNMLGVEGIFSITSPIIDPNNNTIIWGILEQKSSPIPGVRLEELIMKYKLTLSLADLYEFQGDIPED